MSDNRTQQTEQEMLEQTFGSEGYDDEITAQTGDGTKSSNASPEKKKNSNQLLFIAVGAAAAVIVGYMFFIKPMMSPPVEQNQQVAVNQPEQTSPVEVAPQQPASVPEVASQPQIENSANVPVNNNEAENFLSGNQIANPASAVVIAPTENVVVEPQITIRPPVNQPVVVNPTTVVKDNSQGAVVEEIRSLFNAQTQEFKSVLDEVGGKVDGLVKGSTEQKVFNKDIEERVARLESGKNVFNNASVSNESSSVKPVIKPRARVNTVKRTNPVVKKSTADEDVLVSNKEIRERPQIQSAEPLGSVKIHSIYAGRVWIRNSDNSLLTFTVGEKLPTGEVIKKLDDDKLEIQTDKRVIR